MPQTANHMMYNLKTPQPGASTPGSDFPTKPDLEVSPSMSDFSTHPRAGYVYVLTNPAMPGVVKIGRSRHGAASRAKSLSGTSTPTPFSVAFEILCVDAESAEERAHRYANKDRLTAKREFFNLSVRDAVGHVVQAAMVDWEQYEPDSLPRRWAWEPEPSKPCSPEVARAHIAKLRASLSRDGEQ